MKAPYPGVTNFPVICYLNNSTSHLALHAMIVTHDNQTLASDSNAMPFTAL